LLRGLIPKLPIACGNVVVIDLLLARSEVWQRTIVGGLFASLTDALRELLNIVTLRGVVADGGVNIGHDPLSCTLLVRVLLK
jgi:hypothetical protein